MLQKRAKKAKYQHVHLYKAKNVTSFYNTKRLLHIKCDENVLLRSLLRELALNVKNIVNKLKAFFSYNCIKYL